MIMHFVKDGEISGFPNAQIRCVVAPELEGSPLVATNEIFLKPGSELLVGTSQELEYRCIIRFSPILLSADQVTRKEVFAREFLELAIGLQDPPLRENRRTVNKNLRASRVLKSEKGKLIWDETSDDKLAIQRGLEALLLSPESISKYLCNEKGLTKETFLKMVEDGKAGMGQTAEELAEFFSVRLELAEDRLQAFIFGVRDNTQPSDGDCMQ